MPYENEHACRLRSPDDFKKDSFRRSTRKHDGKEYSIIMGKLKNPPKGQEGSMVEQAYRYNKDKWSASSAKSHCKTHDGTFEAAKSEDFQSLSDIERRVLTIDDMELRVIEGENPKITGYAVKFGKWSVDLGGFTERVRTGAFEEAIERSDVRALKNHDPNLLLGRMSSGTLQLKTNSVGLQFEIDAPNTSTGRDVVEEIRRKDITGCSFSFVTAEDDWKYNEDGTVQRTIIKVGQLFDVGPVTYPAYPDTTVAARSLDAFKEHIEKEKSEKEQREKNKKQISAERQREIERGYRKAVRIYNRCKSAEV